MAALGKGAIFLILFFLWCAYVVLGIFVFAATEGNVVHNSQERRERQNMTGLKAETMEKHNMTEAEFETLAKKIREVANSHKDYHDERRWNYIDSFWFVVVLLTTIGYGDLYPVTVIGKVVCGLYAVFGIPITILLLRFIGQQMLRGERALISTIERSCLKRNGPPCHLNEKCFVFGCLYLLILILGGAGASMVTEEGWSYGGSIYFYVITFTTVGFGDMYPQKGRHVTIPFIFLGLTAISNILHAAAAWALVRRVTAGSDESEETTKLTESTEKGTEV
ncbi:two pore potassium channel protein sup-9 [Pocillopora verrucosa]|uniref:two pore potassium channel protein sup-9 n=1 Tax=Pocillopora verrucosa TaxID=203993 RepID=UPI002797A4AB|nr:two pore potassium channel protein sup-9-like [Pocillopora verrucosa]